MTESPTPGGSWTVGQVADRLGVTVRTLHHYDRIGLVVPGGRSPAGYRLYTPDDLIRLQQVVVYRRLEMPLDQIAQVLRSGDVVTHLRHQRRAVTDRLHEMEDLVAALDNALEKAMTDQPMTTEDMKQLFGGEIYDAHDDAQARWGDTPQWAESQERTRGYTRADWERIKAESDELEQRLLALFRADADPAGPEAMEVAQAHREHIDRWFYACPPQMHRRLGELYVSDPAVVRQYDESLDAPGLAAWTARAIEANAARSS